MSVHVHICIHVYICVYFSLEEKNLTGLGQETPLEKERSTMQEDLEGLE